MRFPTWCLGVPLKYRAKVWTDKHSQPLLVIERGSKIYHTIPYHTCLLPSLKIKALSYQMIVRRVGNNNKGGWWGSTLLLGSQRTIIRQIDIWQNLVRSIFIQIDFSKILIDWFFKRWIICNSYRSLLDWYFSCNKSVPFVQKGSFLFFTF